MKAMRKLLCGAAIGALLHADLAAAAPNVPSLPNSDLQALLNAMATGSSAAPMTADGLFNLNASSLPHWRAAMARVRNGSGRGRIVVLGDSTSMGEGAGTGGSSNLNAAFVQGWPEQMGPILSKQIAANTNAIFGDQGTYSYVAYNTYDPRVTLGANWALANINAIGGNTWVYNTGAVNNFAFTPVGSVDTAVVCFTSGGGGTAAVNVDGGSTLGTIGTGSAAQCNTYTFTAGAHTINLVPSNNGALYVLGVIAYLSTTPAVDIIQDGVIAATVSNFNYSAQPYNILPELSLISADLTIIDLTVNDSNNNGLSYLPTYVATVQAMITGAKTGGSDVMLISGPPSNTANATNGTLASYNAALQQLALTNNVPLLSFSNRWTSYAVTNPIFPYYDGLHPGKTGYSDMASAVAQALLNP